jgi:hypothetical protein
MHSVQKISEISTLENLHELFSRKPLTLRTLINNPDYAPTLAGEIVKTRPELTKLEGKTVMFYYMHPSGEGPFYSLAFCINGKINMKFALIPQEVKKDCLLSW